MLVENLLDELEIIFRRNDDAALSEYGLRDEGRHVTGGVIPDHVLQEAGCSLTAFLLALGAEGTAVAIRSPREGDSGPLGAASLFAPAIARAR